MGDIHDDLREVMAISLDRDLDVLPPWPSLPEPWTTASVTYAEDGETCTQRVWTEKQLRAFGKACAQMALNEAAKHGPALLARQEGEDDSARLDWMMHHISGRELREMGVHTIDGCDRAAIDAARSGGGGGS